MLTLIIGMEVIHYENSKKIGCRPIRGVSDAYFVLFKPIRTKGV